MHPRAFISSTSSDLRAHRAELFAALADIRAKARGMEFFGSRPGAPRDECLAEVRTAHVFVLLLGTRYGSVDSESSLSFTHLEYLEAQRLNIPSLIYLIDEFSHHVLPKDVDVGEGAIKLKAFRETVSRSHVVSFFTSPRDLRKKFSEDMKSLLKREKLGLESRELERLVSKLPRLTWLNSDRLDFLIKELGDLASRYTRRLVIKEVIEFLLVGDRQAAVFLTAKHTGLDMRDSIDLCISVERKLRAVVARGLKNLENKRP
jgi:hypothetical protein